MLVQRSEIRAQLAALLHGMGDMADPPIVIPPDPVVPPVPPPVPPVPPLPQPTPQIVTRGVPTYLVVLMCLSFCLLEVLHYWELSYAAKPSPLPGPAPAPIPGPPLPDPTPTPTPIPVPPLPTPPTPTPQPPVQEDVDLNLKSKASVLYKTSLQVYVLATIKAKDTKFDDTFKSMAGVTEQARKDLGNAIAQTMRPYINTTTGEYTNTLEATKAWRKVLVSVAGGMQAAVDDPTVYKTTLPSIDAWIARGGK